MKHFYCRLLCFLFIGSLSASLSAQAVSFTASDLAGESLVHPTSLQFGPDGRLYVSQQNGVIYIYSITRNGANSYQVTATEVITLVQQIPNHNDDGSLASGTTTRQVTGIAVAGTASNPIIYVTSSDPRIGGGSGSTNKNLDTNSGIISRLTWNGTSWVKLDLVRGLPRSEENHSPNGLAYDAANNYLYMAQGGNTNMGAPSNNFVLLPEYALSTAILKINLNTIGNSTYDLPTLDDETRTNVSGTSGYTEQTDPFGGNDGKNQAMLVAGGPVQVYSPGWRNNYDIVITQAGRMYSSDNGPNAGWGGPPSNCSNSVSEPGVAACDVLHYVTQGYFAGHPNPTRGNRNNKFNSGNPQTPVPAGMENSAECTYQSSSGRPQALASICSSTNGLCEYTASNFGNVMKGDLLAASFNGKIYRFKLNAAGDDLVSGGQTVLASNFGSTPLDVIAQGDNDAFPGTVWIATYGAENITILEPVDFPSCIGDLNSFSVDSDSDGFSNGDETANNTDPCSAASHPEDADSDFISDLTDTDDDNDGISDSIDRFALDSLNGFSTTIPVNYEFDNSVDGGILGWGFTGLMTNGGIDYQQLYDADKMTVGGAALKFTIEQVTSGDAFENLNNQQYAYQFGVNVGASQWSYIVHSRVMGPFAGFTPSGNQSMGMFMGTGDEDNYLKIVTAANGGAGGIQVLKEENGTAASTMHNIPVLNTSYVDLFFNVNKNTHEVQPYYSIDGGAEVALGTPVVVPANWLSGVLAVGFIATSRGAQSFPATWDFIEVKYDPATVIGQWYQVQSKNSPTARHECSFVQAGDKFYLMGGRGSKPVEVYNPHDSLWVTLANGPVEMHHFQAVEYNGLIYAICAFTGSYPHETPLPNIYIYDPVANSWTVGPQIPANRRRGSAGVVLYNGKFYIICGIQDGHSSGWVNWVDVFDPVANTWTPLADAPIERDHFNAVVAEGKIYCIGGRRTGWGGDVFGPTVAQVDVYDIAANTWETLPASSNIPTPRAACATGLVGDEILAIGGESGTQASAHNETEAFQIHNHTWRTLSDLIQGRHATNAIVSNGGVFVCAGSGARGGSPELSSQEVFYFFDPAPPGGNAIVKGTLVPDARERFYGMVQPGNIVTKTVRLKNTGGNQVILLRGFSLSDSVSFSIDFPYALPYLLGVNQTVDVEINFIPSALGIKNATLQVQHNGTNNPLSILLQGESSNQFCTSNCVSKTWYPDADGDQYGYPLDSVISALTPANCVLNNGDCDDANALIHPDAVEIADSIDNNCNGAVDEGFGAPKILFVVGNLVLTNSDIAIKNRMLQLGFEVTVESDAASTVTQTIGKKLVFISSTVTSGNIGDKFTGIDVPVINSEYQLFDDLKMTPSGSSNTGTVYTQTKLNIIGSGHPLAGNLPNGSTTIYTATDRLVWAMPAATAAKIATVLTNSNQVVLFGYDTGISMSGMDAPARRVGLFIFDTGADKLNASGTALLDAALLWCADANPPPVVSITAPSQNTTVNAPATVNVSADASTAQGAITKVEFYLNDSLINTDLTAPYAFTTSSLSAGSYSLTATAYSSLGLSASSAPVSFTVQNAPSGAEVLLVVGSTALNSGDLAVKNRLETLGYTVTVKSAASSATADATGKAAVLISSTINSGDVAFKFTNVAVPVIVWEPALLDEMKMTAAASGNFGSVSGANKITVINNLHPLGAGVALGDVQIYASNNNVTYGKPAPAAMVIASVYGNATQQALFGYETGAAMSGMNAPARRVGIFLNDITASLLTPQGQKLFDNAILWCAPAIPPANDCNGVPGGAAYVNDCGICVEGNTGLSANQGKDCNGDCSGTAYLDSCGICSGGNSGHTANSDKDCNGDCNGTAFINSCGICAGGNTGVPANQGTDCNGDCSGTAYLDSCGICSGGNSGHTANSDKDCNGDCNGTAFIDDCGICSGGNTGHAANSNKDACGVCFGDGSSCVPSCVQNEVVSFTLMHAGTAGEIMTMTNGMTINLYTVGSISIRANVCSTPVGSVKFILDGSTFRTETSAPYAIKGDNPAGNYAAWTPSLGAHTLKGTPYTGANGSGTAGISETVTFTVINQSNVVDCNGITGGSAYLNSCNICVGGNTGLSANAGKDCNGDCNGTAYLDDCGICSGGNTGHAAGSDKDTCGVCFGNGSSCATCVPLQVVSFTLVHEGTAGDIAPLTEGMLISLASTGNFSIRANICSGSTAVKSVKFKLNGSTFKTESSAPFALNGDNPPGSYQKWNANPGSYTLKATPYSGTGASGTEGVELIVHFTVVQSAKTEAQADEADEEKLLIYPNPNTGTFNIALEVPQRQELTIRIYNHMGQTVYSEIHPLYEGEYKNLLHLDAPAGMYFIQIKNGDTFYNEKVIVRH